MKKVSILGVGKVGSLIALLLQKTGEYQIQLLDQSFNNPDISNVLSIYPDLTLKKIDVSDDNALKQALQAFGSEAIVSSLPYFLNKMVAKVADALAIIYFDLTEDVEVTKFIKNLAQNSKGTFIPQCGLAPGMVGIIANDLIGQFETVQSVQMRVGALPQFSNHGLKYALTWSTEGVINEYDNPCVIVKQGKQQLMPALESLESIELQGEQYEAFSTSGGLGSLVELYGEKVSEMNYKTIRYPGHQEKMRFLMKDLQLNNKRDILKSILEDALPRTYQDMVIIVVNVVGLQKGQLQAKQYYRKFLPQEILGLQWSAIQTTTAAGVCCVLHRILAEPAHSLKGFVYQELLSLKELLETPFGFIYQ